MGSRQGLGRPLMEGCHDTHLLVRIPRQVVTPPGLLRKKLLRQAHPAAVAVHLADGALARDTVVPSGGKQKGSRVDG